MRLFILTLICAVIVPTMAQAQTKIAVVDMRALLSESKAAKNIQSQIKTRRDSFVTDLTKEEKKLRDLEKKLIEESKEASQDDLASKRKAFEKELIETRKEAAGKRRNLEKAAADASVKLRSEITNVVQTIADDQGYDLVLSMQDVVVGANTLNITDDVMKALNKKVSKISVKF